MSRMRNVLEYLEQSAERFPEKSAVTDGICTYTYKELSKITGVPEESIRKLINKTQPTSNREWDCGILQIGTASRCSCRKGGRYIGCFSWDYSSRLFLCVDESGAANRQVRAGTASSSGCVYCHGQGTSGDGFADCA